ncbi:hypothetical protein QM637_09590 [Pantoea allii]|jgi:hypothetical protein|nr:hypothetical protein [Pantoea allii]MDJ0036091.1 hypothetical protein [Pantoea allii]
MITRIYSSYRAQRQPYPLSSKLLSAQEPTAIDTATYDGQERD